ncbi:MAG: M23 family metallopeptidase [Firmicutes bacterium]|nr:M23 family metallopeptidase [Bacillota bacterium]MBQ9604114.1 M23 family metallopeptidase [Bacillota bacterium]
MTEAVTEITSAAVIPPVDEPVVSDVFGQRVNPVTGREEFHKGIDFAAPEGTEVKACTDGIVADCGYSSSYGNYVKIKGSDYTCFYAHLNELKVLKGDKITQGQTVALSGSTGQSTGPHLHFELYKGDELTDPKFVLETEPET